MSDKATPYLVVLAFVLVVLILLGLWSGGVLDDVPRNWNNASVINNLLAVGVVVFMVLVGAAALKYLTRR
jgi:hypothetical protein